MVEGPDWLPEDLRQDPALKDFKDPAALAKAFKDTKALVGSSIRIPGPDASPEVRAEFRAKLKEKVPELLEIPSDPKAFEAFEADIFARLGRPADEKGYEVEAPPEGLDLADIRAVAKRLGLTKKQFAELVKDSAERLEAARSAAQEQDRALRKEWGAAFDERFAAARAVAVKLGMPAEAAKAMPPSQAIVWFNVAKAMGAERAEVSGQGAGAGTGKLSPREAQAQMDEIRSSLSKLGRNDPRRKHLVEKMLELSTQAYPEE